jgi:lysophospholipase L1-like esterase
MPIAARSRGFTVKNITLAGVATLVTLSCALLMLRVFAPRLVGVPTEVKIVQSSEKASPFYDLAFDHAGEAELLRDPVTVVREPGLQGDRFGTGPTDILGFRNRGVPNQADIITIGDSQTYGRGVRIDDTWPQRLKSALGFGGATVYNMACSGWGPTQYVAISRWAAKLHPRVVIIAYYTGNDAHDAFAQAYVNPRWRRLRVSRSLDKHDQPRVVWPVPESDRWEARFSDGVSTVFTPGYRHAANDRSHAGVREGYDIIAKTATVIGRMLTDYNLTPVFTVIPTKELVYAEKVRAESLKTPQIYNVLVADEAANLSELADRLRGMRRGRYVDVLKPLQHAAMSGARLYPPNRDGHPTAAGHEVIAQAIAPAIRRMWEGS